MNRLFVDNLTVIDFSYLDAKRGIVGESWIVDIELEGNLDDKGMVFDFGHVKKTLKNRIDQTADHKLIIPSQMPGVILKQKDGRIDLGFHNADNEKWIHRSPASAILLLEAEEVSAESLSGFLIEAFEQDLPDNVDGISVALRNEIIPGPYYHYSHGLKKHDGNCQRIAHGHRSKIEIYVNQTRDHQLEEEWANTFQDIYLGTQEDVNAGEASDENNVCFSYDAPQGYFELCLPDRQVYLMETDTTVEWIATHIAEEVKRQLPECDILVKAFEGVGKGAIAER